VSEGEAKSRGRVFNILNLYGPYVECKIVLVLFGGIDILKE
jgi:hypothetical protein